jgi:CopA family copper-resistance protein
MKFFCYTFLAFFSTSSFCKAEIVKYRLEITEGNLNVGGKSFPNKLFINNTVPGPELVFKYGDMAEINVVNKTDHKTLMHWHGILLPNDQDGVPFVNSFPVEAHSEKLYRFPIKQTGTYWYHSHVMFQEADGLFGAIKILPAENKQEIPEETVLFSDLTHESGEVVHRNLKRDGEYYDLSKGTVQSWYKAFATGTALIKWRNSLQRMGGMDYADVAYDFFTANGLPQINLFNQDQQPKRVKLRLINGSSTSIYKITYAGEDITIVAADGLPVEPVKVKILPMSVAETYDVIVDLKPGKKLELRATSLDNSGYSSVWLGKKSAEKIMAPAMPWEQPIGVTMGEMMGMPDSGFWSEFLMVYKNEFSDIPKDLEYQSMDKYSLPDNKTLMPMMSEMKMDKMDMDKDMDMSMGHEGMGMMNMPESKTKMKPEQSFRIMNQVPESLKNNLIQKDPEPIYNELTYGLLKAKEPIDDNPNQKLRVIPFTLNGNMANYVWTINGRPLGPDTYIKIRKGERVRFIMRNSTMMNHPMHLHGHFFRVMTNQGKWSVLKHTVNVAPLSTTVIEFAATEEKDWFFHCHILYHMMDGMTRMVRYEDNPGSKELEESRKAAEEFNSTSNFYLSSKLLAQSNYSRLEGKLFSSYYMFEYDILGNYKKDLEGEVHFARTLTRFLNPYLGAKTEEDEGKFKTTPTLGFTWMLPLRIKLDLKYQPLLDNKIEAQLGNEIQLTDKLQFNFEYSSTRNYYSELEYRQTKHLSFVGSYNEKYDKWGAGLGYTY